MLYPLTTTVLLLANLTTVGPCASAVGAIAKQKPSAKLVKAETRTIFNLEVAVFKRAPIHVCADINGVTVAYAT